MTNIVAHTSYGFTNADLPVDREKAKEFLKKIIDDIFECSYQAGGRKTMNIGFSISGPFGQYRTIHVEEQVEIGACPTAKFGLNTGRPWGGTSIEERA